MSLSIGQKAPSFSLQNAQNETVTLEQFKGKWVVLYFYPKDDTPGCTRQAVGFSEHLAEFSAKNAVVLGVSKDSVASHEAFCTKYALTILLLSDPNKTCINDYGVWQEKTTYGKTAFGVVRSTFLIDPEGILTKIWSNIKVDGHVQAVLAELH